MHFANKTYGIAILSVLINLSCVKNDRDSVKDNIADRKVFNLCVIKKNAEVMSIVDKVHYDIIDYGDIPKKYSGYVCLDVVIVYLGCATGGALCTDYSRDFGVRINRVLDVKH